MTKNLSNSNVQQKIDVIDLSKNSYADVLRTAKGLQLVWATDAGSPHET